MRNLKLLIYAASLALLLCAIAQGAACADIFLISTEQEVNMGRSISKQVENKYHLMKDEALNQRVDFIGEKLAGVCERRDINYRFGILDDKEINAFALPGGYIYIFKGLLDICQTDDELAAILAHEIGHVTERHAIKHLQGSLGYTALSFLTALANPKGIDGRARQVADLAFISMMLSYSREDELQADELSIKYMKAAGYDPKAVVTVLEKLKESRQKGPLRIYSAFRTHPYVSDRIKSSRQMIYGQMSFEDYINTGNDIP